MEEPITLIMSRLHENEEDIRNMALSMLIDHIKKDPSIITVEIVEELILLYKSLKSTPKQKLADILSFIALTSDDIQTLTYRIKGGVTDLKIFGIQYVKKLVNLIIEYNRENDNNSLELFKGSDIKKEELEIVNTECIEFLIDHNAEIDCIDFLYEIKEMNRIIDKVDEYNYERVMQYLKGLTSFDNEINYVMLEIYKKMNKLIDEVLLYVKLRNIGKIEEIINRVDFHQRCQIAYILSKLNIRIENKELEFIINNQYNKKLIQYINKDFEIENPKKIDEILKGIYRNREISTRQFQYISFANGIYHMGTGKDLLLYENKKLIEKNDKVESIGIFASLGFIDFYNPDKLCDALSEFIFAENNYRKSGSLLALAIAGCRTVDTNHTLLALISDSFMDDTYQKISAMLAINLTYSTSLYYSVDKSFPTKLNCNAKLGNQNKNENNFKGDNEEMKNKRKACDYDKIEEIKNLLSFTEKNLEEISMTLLTLSSIYAGTGDISISNRIVSKLLEYSDESDSIFYKIMILSLGLLYINTKGEFKQDQSFSILDFLENDAFDDYISNYIYVVIMGYSYAATSNTYIIEEILSIITSITTLRDVGYLMVALISIGDITSSRMCMRLLGSDSENGRIAAIGLLYASNPLPEIIEFLSKKINTNTLPTIFTLGIIGCGTNNKNIIKLLEDNYSFYQKNTKVFSMMRMAKGLINAGRGIYGINIFPYNNIDIKTLVHLSSALFLILDGDNSINFQKYYFMNYLLAGTLTNKSITTIKINEDIENIEYTNTVISVGNPIDIVGMAGNPKKLSSIQSNASPVVLQVGENGELNDKDKTYTNVIEGIVIMK